VLSITPLFHLEFHDDPLQQIGASLLPGSKDLRISFSWLFSKKIKTIWRGCTRNITR